MKIVVIAKPRSRSSFFSNAISNFFDIKYHHEPFAYYEKWVSEIKARYLLLNKKFELSDVVKHQKNHLHEIKNQLDEEGNYVFKLFPRDIIFSLNGSGITDDKMFIYDIYLNFNEIFKLESFDKIYFLDRNTIDSAMSYSYAWVINQFLFLNKKELEYKLKQIKKINMPPVAFKFMNFHIFESVLHHHIRNYLDRKKIIYTNLDYDTCENYVQVNLKSPKPNMYVESNFDYKNLILNYSECVDHINQKIEEYSKELKNVEFL